MKIIIFILLFLNHLLSNEVPFKNDLSIIKAELSKSSFFNDYKIYINNINYLKELEFQFTKSNEKDEKLKVLSKIIELQNKTNSIIISSIALNSALKTISLKDKKNVKKYIKPISEFLYINKICDGYLLKGEYIYSLNNNIEESLKIYKDGINNCNLNWKKDELVARFNKYSYLYEKRFRK